MEALKIAWAAGEMLPLWMGLVGSIAVFNSVQNYLTLSFTKRVYNRAPSQGKSLFLPDPLDSSKKKREREGKH